MLRVIDFEERRLGNPEELPMHWGKIEEAGYPHYVDGFLSKDRARSGAYGFQFELNGGSLAYRYDAGRVKVRPRSHYRVETYVQTTALKHARARLTAYFVDVDGRKIAGTERHSPLFVSRQGAGSEGWERLAVELSATEGVGFAGDGIGAVAAGAVRARWCWGSRRCFRRIFAGRRGSMMWPCRRCPR